MHNCSDGIAAPSAAMGTGNARRKWWLGGSIKQQLCNNIKVYYIYI